MPTNHDSGPAAAYRCPGCYGPLPKPLNGLGPFSFQTKPTTTHYKDGQIISRYDGQMTDYPKSAVIICICGVAVGVIGNEENERWRYLFRCQRCSTWVPVISQTSKTCVSCVLQTHYRILAPLDLYDSLSESSPYIPPSRDAFLEGFLRGVLRGSELCVEWSGTVELNHARDTVTQL